MVRSGVTGRESAIAARDKLAQDQIEVLGTVLNDWDAKGGDARAFKAYYNAYLQYQKRRKTNDSHHRSGGNHRTLSRAASLSSLRKAGSRCARILEFRESALFPRLARGESPLQADGNRRRPAIIQPLFTMVIFSIFFGRLAKVYRLTAFPYPVFSLSGTVIWTFFANGPDAVVR